MSDDDRTYEKGFAEGWKAGFEYAWKDGYVEGWKLGRLAEKNQQLAEPELPTGFTGNGGYA